MARALRIERAGGRYHVTARGNERQDIFRDDADHFHFLALLSQLGECFGVRVPVTLATARRWRGSGASRWPGYGFESTGGLDYPVVSKALARFGRRLEADPRLREEIAAIQDRLSK